MFHRYSLLLLGCIITAFVVVAPREETQPVELHDYIDYFSIEDVIGAIMISAMFVASLFQLYKLRQLSAKYLTILVVTWAVDYCWVFWTVFVIYYMFEVVTYEDDMMKSTLALWLAWLPWFMKEAVLQKIFYKDLSEHNRDFWPKWNMEHLLTVLLNIVFGIAFVPIPYYLLQAYEYKAVEWTLSYWGQAYAEYCAMIMLADLISYRILHNFLHKSSFYGPCHKLHHSNKNSANGITGNLILGLDDLWIEALMGPFYFYVMMQVLGMDQKINYIAFVLHFTATSTGHSALIWHAVWYNPLLDIIFNMTPHHQLHHLVNNKHGYINLIPYHYLWTHDLKYDLEKCNKYQGTSWELPL